jgi:putative FmdB family regulatory protein
MPTYRYRCGSCGDELEIWQSIKDDALTEHDTCGGALLRMLSPAGIVLKGSGFYKTDARSGSGNGSRTPKPKDGGSSDAGSKDSGSKDSGSKDSGSKESGPKDSGSKSDSGGSSSGKGDSGSGSSSSSSGTKSGASSA